MSNDACEALSQLRNVIQALTGPGGCPWDSAQTPESLADYVVEESHELAAAIRSGSARETCEELGDVFFLLLFICQLRSKDFSLADCLDHCREKMIHRHPHVFAGHKFENLSEQLKAWEALKKEEKKEGGKNGGIFASLPPSLPPLLKAYRIHSRAARAGFTWRTDEEAEQQVESEWLEWLDAVQADDEKAKKHELGDLLFSVVELGRRQGIKANEALDLSCLRFLSRFRRMEHWASEMGKDIAAMPLEEQDELWLKAKEEEAP